MTCQPADYTEEALYKKEEKFEHQVNDVKRHEYKVNEPHRYNNF